MKQGRDVNLDPRSTPDEEENLRTWFRDPIVYLPQIVGFIEGLVEKADQMKAMVFMDDFRRDYPDLYRTIVDLAELPPAQARNAIIRRWPFMIGMLRYRNHLKAIKFLQDQVKLRKQGKGKNENGDFDSDRRRLRGINDRS